MATARAEKFDRFADKENARAQYKMFTRGLGMTNERITDPQDQVRETIDTILGSVEELDEETRISIRDLLEADLSPLLKKKDDRFISMLDVTTLGLTEDEEIKQFLKKHGADLENEFDLAYITRVVKEAIAYYNKNVAGKCNKISGDLVNIDKREFEPEDIFKIFKTAAGKGNRRLVAQSCALLRIITVIDYLEKDPVLSMSEDAYRKLREFKEKHIRNNHRNPEKGRLLFSANGDEHDPQGIPLAKFEIRIKDRERIITKLLHKPENVSAHVLDHVGFRATTKSAQAALALIYALYFDPDTAFFPTINVRPNETTNLLFKEEALCEALKDPRKARELLQHLSEETIDHAELTDNDTTNQDAGNKHSSRKYRATHVTCDMPIVSLGNRRAFPVEGQFLHEQAWLQNEAEANHDDYVARQMETVRARILGNNLSTAFRVRQRNQ